MFYQFRYLIPTGPGYSNGPPGDPDPGQKKLLTILCFIVLGALVAIGVLTGEMFADRLPGTDASDKMEAAGTILRLVDTALFSWGAKILAGICIMSAGWAFKEQKFGVGIVCIIGAIIFGTATTWVKNIFEISGSEGVFGSVLLVPVWLAGLINLGKGGDAPHA